MRLISKGAIITTAGVVLLGTGLALSSAGVVSGSSPPESERQIQHDLSCTSSHYCLYWANFGTSGAIKGTSGVKANSGTAAIIGQGFGFNSFGVEGQSTGSGGTGVEGISTKVSDGVGVFGIGAGQGIAASNTSCCNTFSYGLTSQVSDPSSFPIYTFGAGSTSGSFSVDASANGVFDGSVTAFGGYFTALRSNGGAQVRASVPLAPRATIEDTGTARLNDGVGIVHLGREFASMLDTSKGYQVFLTPDGDTRGWLYVATKYQAGFIVREAERGRSSVYFDYRVVAHLAGTSDERFPIYHPNQPRRPKLPVQPPSGN